MAILHITNDNFEKEVLQSDKTVLVDFFATWCGPCNMQGPIVEEIANENPDIKVCKIDIDEQPELAQKYGVMSIPTIMIVKGGEVTYQQPGLQQKPALLDLLKQ